MQKRKEKQQTSISIIQIPRACRWLKKGIKPEGKTQKEQIDEILDKIQKNTDDIDYRSPFVKEVKVKEWSVKDGKLIVDFNRNYQKLSATEEILLRAAVVQSVGQISGVDAVLFMIDGESLQDMNGQVVGYMQPSDFDQKIQV